MTLTQIKRAGLDGDALDRVFTIGASGNSAYTFQGEGLNGTVNNPTLYLTRGKTYRFENGSGGHPIRIQSTSGASGTAYNTGVTNNAQAGTVIVEVQHDAPDVLYYQCTSHAAMNGVLYITGALADGGVTTAKLAGHAVTNAKLADGEVDSLSLTSNSVTTVKIAADAVTGAKIADDSVDSEHIVDGSIDAAHLNSSAVTTSKLNNNAVDASKLASNAVTTAKIANDAVTGDKLSNHLDISDNNTIRFGSSQDFQLFHESSSNDNIIDCATTRPLRVRFGGANQFEFLSAGGVKMNDGRKIFLGDSSDLQIYHDGSNSYIDENGTGNLRIRNVNGNGIELISGTGELNLKANYNGSVDLYHDNSKKLETTSSGATVTGTIVADNTSGRNIIINGDMRVAQRATSASYDSSSTKILACDRWAVASNGTTGTAAQVAEAPDGSGFKYSMKITNTEPVGSIAAGNALRFAYKVERQDLHRLAYGTSDAKNSVISFWVRGSLSGKIGVACTRNSKVFSAGVDIVANTWKFVEVVIPADTSTALSGNDNDTGMNISISCGAGSNSTSGATGSWLNFHVAYTTGFTAGQQGAYLTTDNSTFQITGVQLEVGSKATPFAHRTIAEETALCERYYQSLVTGGSQYFANGYYYTATSVFGVITHRTRMRTAPTLYQTTGTDYYYIYSNGSGDSFPSFETFHWKNGITGNFRVLSGVSGTAGHAGGLYTTENNARIAFDAEL